MDLIKSISFVSISLLLVLSSHGIANAQTQSNPTLAKTTSALIETGRFHFYETKQIRGEENYEIRRGENGELILTAKTDLPFAEQETKPLINATLRTKADFTPQSFETKGPTLLEIEENSSVTI